MCDIQNCNLNICLPPPSLILQAGVTDGAITGHFGEQMEISWFIEKLFLHFLSSKILLHYLKVTILVLV